MDTTGKQFRKRNAILCCLRSTDTHPSADWIRDRLRQEYPDLSLATVYRNLALFRSQGRIASLGTVGGVERFDGNPAPHVHFICMTCGSIRDLHSIPVPEQLCCQAQCETGGTIAGCNLSFTGICRECQEKSKTEELS